MDAREGAAALEQRFHRLLSENGAALGRLAASYTRSASDRDDLLQEIAIAVWQALAAFRGESSERTFLFRIAHNRAIDYLIRHRARPELADNDIDPADPAPNPETSIVKEQGEQRLARAVRRLPIRYREPVMLLLEGMEYREIAEITGISETNVGARLTRARQMLRQMMEGQR